MLVDRDILSGSINNYMSLVAHKTNQTMSRLTVVSFIFLPLTFLCGVYGMNFDVMPELHWALGYPLAVAMMIVAGVLQNQERVVNPFLTQYAQETRMYSLMLVMSLLATAAVLAAEGPRVLAVRLGHRDGPVAEQRQRYGTVTAPQSLRFARWRSLTVP